MNFKPFMLLAILAVLSLGAFGRPSVHAAPQVHSPLTVNQESAPAQAVCATIPLFDVDEWAQTNKPAITGAEAQQIAEAHAQAGCARQIKLDEEDCRLVYKIKVAYIKVKVDAMTGVIIETDYTDD